MPCAAPSFFSIFLVSLNCLMTRFTSATEVPLPAAIRLRIVALRPFELFRRVARYDEFDVAEMSKRTLGRHWSARTDAEREEVARLFGELLERSYLGKLETYSGEHVAYAGEAVDGDHAVVRTRVSTRNGTEVPIDYRMLRRGERWMVYDVVIEGVSLVANYRSQFDRIIRSASYAEFVKRLRARIDEPPADSRAAAR